ncbi:MAG TPA: tetratricopeptide repeat protein [Bryobacteraceae bacterium]|nr:tetratricopeptide repeat protein [Bryobacteraceae bacterium]
MIRLTCFSIVLLAATGSWAANEIQPLDLQPGLWEIALTVKTSGLLPMPPEVLAKLTPEQRAEMDDKTKKKAAERAQTTVRRSCLEERELQRPLMLTFGGAGQGCTQTVGVSTPTRQEIRVDCGKGTTLGGGTVLIEVTDTRNAKVTSQWSATDGSRTMKMTSTAVLKWLGSECEAQMAAALKPAVPDPAPAPQATLTAPKAPAARRAAAKFPPPPESAPPTKADAAYYYKQGREKTAKNELWEALQSFNKALEMDPKNPLSYNARGYVYLRLRSYANAIVEFSEAIRLRPEYANAFQNRAIALRRTGDEKGAAADERKAAELLKGH